MPSYRDKESGKWFCKFYYVDYTGAHKQKKKRGFTTKREAQAWEREFLLKQQGKPEMTFESLFELYKEDAKPRLKATTYKSKISLITRHVLPYFKDKKIMDIKPIDVRRWQDELKKTKKIQTGEPLAPGTIRELEERLCAIFNFAVKYYNLPSNPMSVAGHLKFQRVKDVQFWTETEFEKFINTVDEPQYHCVFMTLYYTGVRIGECLALTPNDIDTERCEIKVNKTLYTYNGERCIGTPKTAGSNRVVAIPDFLRDELVQFMALRYDLGEDESIFLAGFSTFRYVLRKYAKIAGIKPIRVHDLRHSHASLLIELGYSPLLIAERLGHDNVNTTLNTYSHLYPNKQKEVALVLNGRFKSR